MSSSLTLDPELVKTAESRDPFIHREIIKIS